VYVKSPHIQKEGGRGDLPGELNPYPEIMPAGRGWQQEGYQITGLDTFIEPDTTGAGMSEMQHEFSITPAV
jgi:hypothetical protein